MKIKLKKERNYGAHVSTCAEYVVYFVVSDFERGGIYYGICSELYNDMKYPICVRGCDFDIVDGSIPDSSIFSSFVDASGNWQFIIANELQIRADENYVGKTFLERLSEGDSSDVDIWSAIKDKIDSYY